MGIRQVFIPLAFAFAFVSVISSPLRATIMEPGDVSGFSF
jgi:hypothetical protein